jgi:hypothetical protein
MSIQLPIGPRSTSSLIRSNSNFEVDYITLNSLYSSNTINTNNLNVTNILNIYNDTNVHNNLNVTNNINITGDLNLITGNINLNNDLNITGDINMNGIFNPSSLIVSNDIQANNINITANLIVDNNTILGNSLIVNGNNLVVDNTNLRIGINVTNPTEALDVNGNSNLRNNLIVDGSVLIRGQDNFNEVNFESFSKWTDGLNPETQIFSKGNKYVGIGMSNPTNLLDVSGPINTKDHYKILDEIVISKNTIGTCITSSNLQDIGTLNDLTVAGSTNLGNLNIIGNLLQTGNLNITGNHQINNLNVYSNDLINITSNVDIYNNSLKVINNVQDSIKMLPPKRLSGNIQEVDEFLYGNGTYNLTTSSSINNITLFQIMDLYNDTYFSSDNDYNETTGVYEGSNTFNSINGEYIKFEIPEANVLDNLVIKVVNSTIANNNPIDFKIFASTNDINWTLLSDQIGITWIINNTDFTMKQFDIVDTNSYKYFTIVVTKCGGENDGIKNFNHFNIVELNYNFKLDYKHINIYSSGEYLGIGTTNPINTLDVLGDINISGAFKVENVDIFNTTLITNLREYPPTQIPINSINIKTLGETVEEGTLTNNVRGYGDGNYSIYYSSISPFFYPNGLGNYIFDKRFDTNYYYRSRDTYNTNTGSYEGTSTLNGVNGEYLILQLPNTMLIKTYRIYNNIYDSEYMSPNSFQILASNDKVSWTVLDTQSNQSWDTTNAYNFKEYDVYTTILYRYFAIVVSKVGNDTIFINRTSLKIQQLLFYGVEFNKYGVNYDTGLYINGSNKITGDLEVMGNIKFGGELSLKKSTFEDIIVTNKIALGIGEASNGLLEINGNAGNSSINNGTYLNSTSVGVSGASTSNSFSIYANGKVAALEFNAVSDIRVKNIINERSINDDLQLIKKMRTYDYSYIDKKNDGYKEKIGFIAQEIKSISQNFTNESKRFIPNIYKRFSLKTKNRIITIKKLLLDKGDLIKVEVYYDNQYKIFEVNVLEISENEVYINLSTELDINLKKGIFIYGKYVDNFLTVDINQITSVNTNIIKYLLKKVESLENRIKNH